MDSKSQGSKSPSLCSSRISTWNAITFGQIFRQFICSLIWINPIDCITTWIRRANFFPSVFLTVFLFLNPIWPGGGYINPPQIFFRDKLVCNACRSCRTVLWVFSLSHRAYFETKFVRSRHAVTKCTIIQDVQKLALFKLNHWFIMKIRISIISIINSYKTRAPGARRSSNYRSQSFWCNFQVH